MKAKITSGIIMIFILLALWFRVAYYGDLRLSIATNDTSSYINSSKAPLFSWKSFAGKRLFSTNLIYKLANDEEQCKVMVTSYPDRGEERFRELQPCFDRIVLLQNILNIAAWCSLAWVTAHRLRSPFLKITSLLIILAFGFVPQIAEWDSVLSIESFTISFFIINIALLLEIVFLITNNKDLVHPKKFFGLAAMWLALYTFWVFLRDVHLYTIPITLSFILVIWFIHNKSEKTTLLVFITIFLIGIFILGYTSAKDSLRATHDPVVHVFDRYIAPYPSRLDFFRKFGMPELGSPEFENWFDYNAVKTYGMFLLTHPRFVLLNIFEGQIYFKLNFSQPYYPVKDTETQINLIRIGEIVHPESLSVYLILIILFIVLWIRARKTKDPWLTGWAWLTSWVSFCAGITLFLTFFGDINGTFRHVFPSIEIIRLSVWLNLAMILDHAIGK